MSTADTQDIYRNIPNRVFASLFNQCARCILKSLMQGCSCYQKNCKEKLILMLIIGINNFKLLLHLLYTSAIFFLFFIFFLCIYMYHFSHFPLVLLVCLLVFQSVTVGHINSVIRVFFLHGHFNGTSIHIINYCQWEVSTSSILKHSF